MKVAAGIIGTIILVVAIAVGGWIGGWWVKAQTVTKNAQIYQTGYGAQSAYAQQLNSLISQIATIDVQVVSPQTPAAEKAALDSQRASVVTQACDMYSKITAPASNQSQFAATNCN